MRLLERLERGEFRPRSTCSVIGTTAALIAGGLAAGGAVTQGVLNSSAAGKAADTQAAATSQAAILNKQAQDQALDFQRRQYLDALNLASPYYSTGTGALSQLAYLSGVTPGAAPTTNVSLPLTAAEARASLSPEQQGELDNLEFQIRDRQNLLAGQGTSDGSWRPGQSPTNQGTIAKINNEILSLTNLRDSKLNDFSLAANAAPKQVNNGGSVPVSTMTAGPLTLADGGAPQGLSPDDFGSLTRSFTGQDFNQYKDPGYDFRLAEGQKALERSAAARGGLLTGGTAKALTRYAQDYGAGEYMNAYNRFNNDQTNRFNRLSNLAGIGQTTATTLNVTGGNTAANVGNILTGGAQQQGNFLQDAANARASSYLYGAQNTGGALNSGLNNFTSLYDLFTRK